MRKLGDEASDRPEPREKEDASAAESARETRSGPVEKPLQKLIEKIVGSRAPGATVARRLEVRQEPPQDTVKESK